MNTVQPTFRAASSVHRRLVSWNTCRLSVHQVDRGDSSVQRTWRRAEEHAVLLALQRQFYSKQYTCITI